MGDAADDLALHEAGLDHVPDGPYYTWTTKEGKKLEIKDMQTSHIQNCIRMLHRQLASRPDEYAWGEPDGDAAMDAFNSEISHNDQIEEDIRDTISHFERELRRRGEGKEVI